MKNHQIKTKLIKGFTLIEVMVVVVIMAILAAIIVPRIMSRPDEAKLVKVKQDIASVSDALDLYRIDNGQYPTQAQGLAALVTKPTTPPAPENYSPDGYLKQMPTDPWGHPYHYVIPGKHSAVDIFTYGENNQPGGTGINAERGNWSDAPKAADAAKTVSVSGTYPAQS
jgi:general secretion pathway protein G